jgi:hypothetical protein
MLIASHPLTIIDVPVIGEGGRPPTSDGVFINGALSSAGSTGGTALDRASFM